ncbi:PIN domain-containing protein [Rhizobium leguminosarum]|uniref:type II toxin-antitoxin system VapC family toxin n=1 Tax=Rhizobium leguminosarum TaxID=384 RepID=UPI0013FC06FD|nr:PIN domain-containing protein [Rhizobium leguminosarum]NEJ82295.1 PIN domain-containing protein [Rhizobium leguminosarum]
MSSEGKSISAGRPRLLLDTNIVSARARRRPPEGLQAWLQDVSEFADFCLCFPVMIEIKRGLRMTNDPAVAARVRAVVEDLDRADFIYFGMGKAVEDVLASMMANRALKNFWQPQPNSRTQRVSHDLMIAATAIAYDTCILTTDGDYQVIDSYHPLPGVYDPLRGRWLVEPTDPIDLPPMHPTLQAF